MVQSDLHFVSRQRTLDCMKPVAGVTHDRLAERPSICAAHTGDDRSVGLVTSPYEDADFAACQAHKASGWVEPEYPEHGGARCIG